MKKHILTKEIKKYKKLQQLIFWTPIVLALLLIPDTLRQLDKFNGNVKAMIFQALLTLFSIFVLAMPFYLYSFSLLRRKRIEAIKNATFESAQGIDYYRDKIEYLSPVEISFLSDLKLEKEKDIAAQLLQYELWGLIKNENGKVTVLNMDDSRLKERDKVLLKMVQDEYINFDKWEEICEKEMEKGPYFQAIKMKKHYGLRLSNLLLIIFIILFLIFTYFIYTGDILRYMDMMDTLTEPDSLIKTMENMTTRDLIFMTSILIAVGLIYATFFVGMLVYFKNRKDIEKSLAGGTKLSRTNLGNEITEYIYGIKNYIKDFTLLSEREKKELLLWEDFLIYATLLEENEEIIKEVVTLSDKKTLANYRQEYMDAFFNKNQ